MASGAKNAISNPEGTGRAGLVATAIVAVALLALWPSAWSAYEAWVAIHDYQHGFLIAGISVFWFAIEARRLGPARLRPDPLGGLLLLVVLFAWLVAYKSNSLVAHQLLWPLALLVAVYAGAGRAVARRFVAPLGFLYFAIPAWDYLVPLLQRLCVVVTESTLAVMGIPTTVTENVVTIPEGSFQIVEGCSGKRYFVVALAVAVLAVRLFHLAGRRGIALIALSGVLALVANWLRILIVVVAGHLSNMQHYFVAVEHLTLGNVIFAVLLGAILFVARRLSRARQLPEAAAAWPTHVKVATSLPASRRWPTAVTFFLLAGTFAAARPADDSRYRPVELGPLPLATGRWQGPLPGTPAWMPSFVGTAGERRAAYASQAGTVELYVNVYGAQRQGQELVQYANTLLAPGAWHRSWSQESQPLSPRARFASFEARASDGGQWLFAFLFDVGGWSTSRPPLAQLAYGLRAIRAPVPAGLVALAVRCEEDCATARALASAFWDDMSQPILGMLPPAGLDR